MRLQTAAVLLALGMAVIGSSGAAASPGFQAIYSQDGIDVWAVGDSGVIYRSFDQGAEYFRQTVGSQTLRGVSEHGLKVVLVGDQGQIWRSMDSGGTWTLHTLAGSPDLRGLEMPTDQLGWAVGAAGTIVTTADGG